MSLSCIADFRVALQVLPEKFSSAGQREQYALKYWEGTVKESIATSKFFMSHLESAKTEEMPAALISHVLVPVLRKMVRDAQSSATRTEGVQNAIADAPVAVPAALRIADAPVAVPAALRSRSRSRSRAGSVGPPQASTAPPEARPKDVVRILSDD